MTETIEPELATPLMPEDLHEEARALVRDLAATAGDADATYAVIQQYCQPQRMADAFSGLAASLLVIFTECITDPTGPGEYAATSFPTD